MVNACEAQFITNDGAILVGGCDVQMVSKQRHVVRRHLDAK